MLKKIGDLLVNEYGYEHRGFISHPLKDRYDAMYGSGRITVLLTEDLNTDAVAMTVVENEVSTSTRIANGRLDYADVVLHTLAEFALTRMAPR